MHHDLSHSLLQAHLMTHSNRKQRMMMRKGLKIKRNYSSVIVKKTTKMSVLSDKLERVNVPGPISECQVVPSQQCKLSVQSDKE